MDPTFQNHVMAGVPLRSPPDRGRTEACIPSCLGPPAICGLPAGIFLGGRDAVEVPMIFYCVIYAVNAINAVNSFLRGRIDKNPHIRRSSSRLSFRFLTAQIPVILKKFECREQILRLFEKFAPAHLEQF